MALSLFSQIAKPHAPSSPMDAWGDPQLRLNLGGSLAVWCEKPASNISTDSIPWLVLHGGPGGSTSPTQVLPLRHNDLSWFAFDQRNSGLSEDLPLDDIDTQRLIDDALQIADRLGLPRFRILAGSWGAALAIMMAAAHPDRVRGLVLRAPFLPWRSRVDAFFASLEDCSPAAYAQCFGEKARTLEVCQRVLDSEGADVIALCSTWSHLEESLLTNAPLAADWVMQAPTDKAQQNRIVRKYKLQAHFLFHDCFIDPNQWQIDISNLASHKTPVHVVQGESDKICPPAGAMLIHELLPHSFLTLLPHTGHLSSQKSMIDGLSQAVAKMRWR